MPGGLGDACGGSRRGRRGYRETDTAPRDIKLASFIHDLDTPR